MTFAKKAIRDHLVSLARAEPDRFAGFMDTYLAALVDYYYNRALPVTGDELAETWGLL